MPRLFFLFIAAFIGFFWGIFFEFVLERSLDNSAHKNLPTIQHGTSDLHQSGANVEIDANSAKRYGELIGKLMLRVSNGIFRKTVPLSQPAQNIPGALEYFNQRELDPALEQYLYDESIFVHGISDDLVSARFAQTCTFEDLQHWEFSTLLPVLYASDKKNLSPVIVDVGCNIGSFSIPLAKRHPHVQVICIEIQESLTDMLECAKLLNQLSNLNIIRSAVVPQHIKKQRPHIEFRVPDPHNWGGGQILSQEFNDDGGEQRVSTISVQDIFQQYDSITAFKIDIELLSTDLFDAQNMQLFKGVFSIHLELYLNTFSACYSFERAGFAARMDFSPYAKDSSWLEPSVHGCTNIEQQLNSFCEGCNPYGNVVFVRT